MLFSAYDSNAIRLLSPAHSGSLGIIQKSLKRALAESEKTDFSKTIAENLMKAYDFGERNPEALSRAALQGIGRTAKSRR